MDARITLRPVTPGDEAFLYRVYASTRTRELASLDWDNAQKEAFLQMQFAAQHRFYLEQFPQAEFRIVYLDGEPIGRLYADRRDDEIRIVDLALLPEHRNQGTGTTLLREILTEGQRTGLPVRIHVEGRNPAMSLYHRLGFRKVGEHGIYHLMERSPESVPRSMESAG